MTMSAARPPLPVLDVARIGPLVGERFPDVALHDRYQAGSADECYPPDEVVLRIPLEGRGNVGEA